MRTRLTVQDLKNMFDNIFNGNLWQSKANSSVLYVNPNSEPVIFKYEDGEEDVQDLARYLNVKFYCWKDRLVEKDGSYENGGNFSVFEDWVQSLNYSLKETYALVEKVDEEVTASQDIDSATITGKITFIVQADKISNLDYYVTKLRNTYLGNVQDFQNSYGDIVKMYVFIGALNYDEEPMMTQLGETLVVSLNFKFSYLGDAQSWGDTKIEISLDGDDTYSGGAIVGTTKYLEMPLTKASFQAVMASNAVPTAERPDLTGFLATTISNIKTLSFYDFNKALTNRINDLFWSLGAIKIDGEDAPVLDVNIPVYIRITNNGHFYVYKDMIDNMQKSLTNNDFNIASITLKGWGKII